MFGWLDSRRIYNNFVCVEIQNLTKNSLQVQFFFRNYAVFDNFIILRKIRLILFRLCLFIENSGLICD